VIVANRITDDIRDVEDKVFSRDLFGKDWCIIPSPKQGEG
jgi:hypothetical protein